MKRLYAAITVLCSFVVLLLPGTASALTYSPPAFDISADPGQTIGQTLKLRNETSTIVTITVSSASFSAKEEGEASGVPEFYPSSEERDGHGLGGWISFDQAEFTLLPGERAELPFTVRVPGNAGPGSYFGAIMLGTQAARASSDVGVMGTAAALVFLRVNGTVIEDLKLSGFSATPRISDSLPARFEALVENAGTVHLRPYGEVTVKDMFGRVVAIVAMNRLEHKSVLPGTSRRFSTTWQRRPLKEGTSILARQWQNFAFGPHTAELTLHYGEEDHLLVSKTQFWVFPWLATLLVIGGAALLVLSLRRFFGWYRNRIIRRYETRQ